MLYILIYIYNLLFGTNTNKNGSTTISIRKKVKSNAGEKKKAAAKPKKEI